MLNKWIKGIISAVVATGLISYVVHNYINFVEKKQNVVTIDKKKNKTLFFYRDDCKDCQKVFHHVYWKNVFNKNIEFVNMNQKMNRKYIKEYDLKSVPSFVNKNEIYSGTKISDIDHIMENNK